MHSTESLLRRDKIRLDGVQHAIKSLVFGCCQAVKTSWITHEWQIINATCWNNIFICLYMTDIWESNWVHDVTTSASCSVSRGKVSELLNKTSLCCSFSLCCSADCEICYMHQALLTTELQRKDILLKMWYLPEQSSHLWQVSREDRDVPPVPAGLRVPWDHHFLDLLSSPAAQTKQEKVVRLCVGTPNRVFLLTAVPVRQEPHLLASLSWSACGSSISCGSRFSLWTHFTLHKKKKKINPTLNLSSGKSLLCYLYLFMASLSVQACLGNPSHPVEREEQMGCSAGTCTAWTAALQLINFPTLSPFAPLSPLSPREPWRANESVLHHV